MRPECSVSEIVLKMFKQWNGNKKSIYGYSQACVWSSAQVWKHSDYSSTPRTSLMAD